jgi:hypothetical protein
MAPISTHPDPGRGPTGTRRRALLSLALCVCVAWTPVAVAAPPPGEAPVEAEPLDDRTAVGAAEQAWLEGKWTEVRGNLEPLASDRSRLGDPIVREKALLYLADATVQDASLGPDERRTRASAHLERLIDADPGWQLQRGAYSDQLYELYRDVLDRRGRETARACGAALEACRADREEDQTKLAALRLEHQKLQEQFAEQEVEVREGVARSRLFAAIPFGVGHFYNGDRALGATFLAAEVGFGVSALGLVLYRTINDGCRRTRGFQRGSLSCAPGRDLEAITQRRQAEEVMAWAFGLTILADIIVAQIRFIPYETIGVRRIRRKDLESDDGEVAPPRARDQRRRDRRRAKLRPAPAMIPGGAGLGVDIHF